MTKARKVLVSALCFTALIGEAAVGREQVVLKPSGQWNINYADESCQLARTFGVGDQKTLVQFERFGPENGFALMIVSPLLKFQENFRAVPNRILHPTKRQYLDTVFQFLPAGEPHKQPGIPAMDAASRQPTLMAFLSLEGPRKDAAPTATGTASTFEDLKLTNEERLALEKATNALLVEQPFNDPIRFELGSLAQPFATLAACTDDLVRSWGLQTDPEHAAVNPPKPIGSPSEWFDDKKLAERVWSKQENAIIYFRMIVSDKGAPESCIIQDSSQTAELRDLSCRALMGKARFTPGTNAAGQSVRSVYRGAVRYFTSRN